MNIWRIFIDTILSIEYPHLRLYASKHTAIHTMYTELTAQGYFKFSI